MVLEVIYVVRHGYRLNWTVNPSDGTYHSTSPTPTGIPADVQLASYGSDQADQLAAKVATLDPIPDVVYSSPWYRCIQTIAPSVKALARQCQSKYPVRIENGVGEFFGTARFTHPSPAPITELTKHFDFVDVAYKPQIRPSSQGETPESLHNRHAYALHRMVQQLDTDPQRPRAAIICTHAASMICIGRVLTGKMPSDLTEDDFRCGTCALSRFDRRTGQERQSNTGVGLWNDNEPDEIPHIDWKEGRGIAGGWDCTVNGDCSHLSGGEERTWHFTGDESFINDPQINFSEPDLPLRIIQDPEYRSSTHSSKDTKL